MSDNKFTEHMEVEAVGTLKPGDIGWGTCDGCEKNIHKFPGVLLQGITEEAAKLLYEKVEIVPEGTKARMAKLESQLQELKEEKACDEFVKEHLCSELKKSKQSFWDLRDVMEKRLGNSGAMCQQLIEMTNVLKEARQDKQQLRERINELEASNKELLEALEDFVIDVEVYFGFSETDDMQLEADVAYFISEYRTAKHLIQKEKGIQQ